MFLPVRIYVLLDLVDVAKESASLCRRDQGQRGCRIHPLSAAGRKNKGSAALGIHARLLRFQWKEDRSSNLISVSDERSVCICAFASVFVCSRGLLLCLFSIVALQRGR